MTNFLSSATHLRAYLNERQFFLDELELNRDNYDCNLYSVCEAFLKKHKESHKEYLSQEASEKRDLYVTTGTHSVLRTVRYVLEQPQETLIGTIVLTITNLVNLLAVVTALMETFPQLNLHVYSEKRKVFFHIEIFLTAFFGLELLLRFVTARDHLRFFLQINSVIDIVAVVPLFVALITNARKTELRTLRLVRVLKMSRDTLGMQVLLRTLRASFQALVGPGLLLTFCVLVMGTFVYFAEHGEYDPNVGSFLIMNCTCESENIGASMECKKIPATFVSIPHAMWWALVTWTNIGYGDVVPICPVAKTLGTVTAASGTVFLSFPVVIIGTYLYHITQSSSRERERVTITRRGGTKRTTAGSNNRMLSVEDAVSPGELLMQYVTERLHVLEKRGAIECISNQPPPKSLVHVIEEYCSVSCPECKEGECNLPDERVLPDSVNRRRVTIEDPKNKSFLVLELVGVKQAGKRVGASRIIAPDVIELPISEFEWHVGTPSTDVPDADILLPCDCDGAQTRHAVFSYNFHSRALTVRPYPCVTYQTEDEKSLRGKNNLTTYVSVNNQMVPASGTKVKAGDKIGFSNNALHEELFKVERRAMMDISEVLST